MRSSVKYERLLRCVTIINKQFNIYEKFSIEILKHFNLICFFIKKCMIIFTIERSVYENDIYNVFEMIINFKRVTKIED